MHAIGGKHNDTHMTSFLEDKYLHEQVSSLTYLDWITVVELQVESINEIAKIVTNLKRLGPGMGEYVFDKEHFDD